MSERPTRGPKRTAHFDDYDHYTPPMSDPYVPTTEEVRRDYAFFTAASLQTGEATAGDGAARFDRWLAGVRADQAEVDAVIADQVEYANRRFDGLAYQSFQPKAADAAAAIRRAVALTPTTEETEQ